VATVLFTWELGGGLGHVLPMRPLAAELLRRGHVVFVALRDLTRCAVAFGHTAVCFVQAPYKPAGPTYVPRPQSHAHLMANVGFGSPNELYPFACAWRRLLEWVRPGLVVFDHSPTALLAARAIRTRRVLFGTGFCCPPDACPFPAYRDLPAPDDSRIAADERRVLGHVNGVLAQWKLPEIDRLAQLYSETDDTILTTFAELDHYGDRGGSVRYWGPVITTGGMTPQWPSGEGPRVYACLKPCDALPDLLGALIRRGNPTIIYGDGIGSETTTRFATDTLRFERGPLDLRRVAETCDVIIHNGNHGTAATFLLAGKPMLQLPLTREQAIGARCVADVGAGEVAPTKAGRTDELERKLNAVLSESRFAAAATEFARCHADFDPKRQRREMVERVEQLLGRPPTGDAGCREERPGVRPATTRRAAPVTAARSTGPPPTRP
jgi:hypothetical protein